MKHYTIGADGKLLIDTRSIAKNCSLFIAVPCYAKPDSEFVLAKDKTVNFLAERGIKSKVHWHRGNSAPDLARCMCVAEYMQTGFTHFLFVDDDLHWPDNEVVRMLAMDLPVLGGNYPKKFLFFNKLDDAIMAADYRAMKVEDRLHLIRTAGSEMTAKVKPGGKRIYGAVEAEKLPGGFLLIQRWVFETLAAKRPDLKFKINDTDKINEWMFAFFQHSLDLQAGTWIGEDYFFSDLCRECGIELWVDTLNVIQHIGSFAYMGDPAAVAA